LTSSCMDPSWSERDRSDGPPQGRGATAVGGRLRHFLPPPTTAVVGSGRRNGPLWSKQGRVLAEPGGRWSVGQSGVVMAEPIDKSVLTRQRGGVAGVETHSRRLVWMNRSALPLVRGV
jgi:hypothetical protein